MQFFLAKLVNLGLRKSGRWSTRWSNVRNRKRPESQRQWRVWLQKFPLWGNRPESQLLSEERQNGDNMTQSILAPQAGYVPPIKLTNFERQWQQYQENFMRNLTDTRFKNKYGTQVNNLQKRPIHELKVDRQDSIDFDRQMTNTCESLVTRIQ